MLRNLGRLLGGVVLVLLVGCSGVTDPRFVTSFQWTELEDPTTVTPGITASVAYGEVFILGQLNTPAQCYELTGDFGRASRTLTLRVRARRTNAPNCIETLAGFSYTAVMSNLSFGEYTLTVTHDVDGGTGGVYTESVTVR
jgi:hypothetical protein